VNKKELLLLLMTILVTVGLAVFLLRFFAPGLLGVSRDLQMVQISQEVPPFYENVFREEDYSLEKFIFKTEDFILQDPFTVTRARPLWPDQVSMGPNDILGFRNRAIPNVADVVALGDSQTYGNNVPLELNWPSRLKAHISHADPVIYNIAVGSWEGLQYLEMFPKALFLKPRVVIVALYTGNDPLEAFAHTYGSEHWKDFRVNRSLDKTDAPKIPKYNEDLWPVRFRDGTETVFTPSYRLRSNLRNDPAVSAGYEILKEVGRRIGKLAGESKTPVIFTIIPTKELVYEKRVLKEGIPIKPSYRTLVENERMYLNELAESLKSVPDCEYVDVLAPMEQVAMTEMLYPSTGNGHPVASGYDVIAMALASSVGRYLKSLPQGMAVMQISGGQSIPVLVENDGYWIFSRNDLIIKNGWRSLAGAAPLSDRDLAIMPVKGFISTVDIERFGPQAFQ
jgi:lysophospholipase L1-like esterase